MPGHFGDGGAYGPHPWSPLAQLVVWGLSTLFWIGLPMLFVWLAIQSRQRQNAAPPLAQASEPSAVELLRRRYVAGEIDTLTFEEMLGELMASEERERMQSIRALVERSQSTQSTQSMENRIE